MKSGVEVASDRLTAFGFVGFWGRSGSPGFVAAAAHNLHFSCTTSFLIHGIYDPRMATLIHDETEGRTVPIHDRIDRGPGGNHKNSTRTERRRSIPSKKAT